MLSCQTGLFLFSCYQTVSRSRQNSLTCSCSVLCCRDPLQAELPVTVTIYVRGKHFGCVNANDDIIFDVNRLLTNKPVVSVEDTLDLSLSRHAGPGPHPTSHKPPPRVSFVSAVQPSFPSSSNSYLAEVLTKDVQQAK